jgi:hypothetical protein
LKEWGGIAYDSLEKNLTYPGFAGRGCGGVRLEFVTFQLAVGLAEDDVKPLKFSPTIVSWVSKKFKFRPDPKVGFGTCAGMITWKSI